MHKQATRTMNCIFTPLRIYWAVMLVVLYQWIGRSSAFAARHGHHHARRTVLSSASSTPLADYDELPPDFPRRDDVLVALNAVRKACRVTNSLQPENLEDGISTVEKADTSPVTIADFSCQALVLHDLHKAFPDDSFIAEESSSALDEDAILADQVLAASSLSNVDQVKESIDLGKDYLNWEQRGGRPKRVWTLDPVDGTRGLMRGKRQGGQYCIALALLEVSLATERRVYCFARYPNLLGNLSDPLLLVRQDGIPTIGVLGCPNLPVNPSDFDYAWRDDETEENNKDSRGCIFVASRGGGCYQLPLTPGSPSRRIYVTPNDESTMKVSDARFCIGMLVGVCHHDYCPRSHSHSVPFHYTGVEKYSDALGQCAGMAQVIHGKDALNKDGEIVRARRIDSQAKHGVLARAGAEFYVRLPKPGYVEWIWDHAAGNVVVEEAGGTMTDVQGKPIDFSLGPQLSPDVAGVLASNGGVFHSALVDSYCKQEEFRLSASSALGQQSSQ